MSRLLRLPVSVSTPALPLLPRSVLSRAANGALCGSRGVAGSPVSRVLWRCSDIVRSSVAAGRCAAEPAREKRFAISAAATIGRGSDSRLSSRTGVSVALGVCEGRMRPCTSARTCSSCSGGKASRRWPCCVSIAIGTCTEAPAMTSTNRCWAGATGIADIWSAPRHHA